MDPVKELMRALLALSKLLTVESEARSLVRDLLKATLSEQLPPLFRVALNMAASQILQISSHILEVHQISSDHVSNAIRELQSKPVEPDKEQTDESIEDMDIRDLPFPTRVEMRLRRGGISTAGQLSALLEKEGIAGLRNLPFPGYVGRWQFGSKRAEEIVRIFNQWWGERVRTKAAEELDTHAEIMREVPTAYSYEAHPAE